MVLSPSGRKIWAISCIGMMRRSEAAYRIVVIWIVIALMGSMEGTTEIEGFAFVYGLLIVVG
jgi:hypothetical protein